MDAWLAGWRMDAVMYGWLRGYMAGWSIDCWRDGYIA